MELEDSLVKSGNDTAKLADLLVIRYFRAKLLPERLVQAYSQVGRLSIILTTPFK